MTTLTQQITIKKIKIQLWQTLAQQTKKTLAKINKDLVWLQYVKTTKTGKIRFLSHKEPQWQTIEKIASAVAKKIPHYSYGQIIDILSHLTSATVLDELKASKLQPTPTLDTLERSYLKKLLIEIIDQPNYIPLYPWFMPIHATSENKWQAKDLSSGNKLNIHRTLSNDTLTYSISS